MDTVKLWDKSLSMMAEKVGAGAFERWLKPVSFLSLENGIAVIEVPNRFFKEWIEDFYPSLISDTLSSVTGASCVVKYRISEKADKAKEKEETKLETRKARLAGKGIFLHPKYTFDSFVVGTCNQFAQAAAMKVAESPGSSYNPLYVYGGVGLGKTHLISAIGNYAIDKRKAQNILYVSAEQFTTEVVFAVRHGKTEELKNRYRSLDLLLLDDVQIVENKNATQEELFHTINALYSIGKQIVFSADRPPKEMKNVTDRLRSRFSMGLMADIEPPDLETRIAIIQKKADYERIKLPQDVAHFLASAVHTNIRDLEGCLISLGAHASLTGAPIDLKTAKQVLRHALPDHDRPVNVEAVLKTVAEHFGAKPLDLKSKKRTQEIAVPRQIAMYLSRKLTDSSLGEIGKHLGGKNHATVIYACKQVEDRRGKDETFDRMIESLSRKIKP